MSKILTENPRQEISLLHERVDDIPVLIALALRLGLPELLEQHLGTHGQQQGLGNGWLATIWLVFILSQGDHTKYSVEPWVSQHHITLQKLTGLSFASAEFNDDRLGVVLRRMGQPQRWAALEDRLWKSTTAVYQLKPEAVWLDTTTASGHHEPQPGGLMQNGYSKDHRPDLAQLKLMAAAAQPLGHLMASEVHPGNAADDPLYTPMIKRVRGILGRTGMLYVGDSKMSALSTRAELVLGKDLYLMPLPQTGKTAELLSEWVESALCTEEQLEVLHKEQGQKLGVGYELSRTLKARQGGRKVQWKERVMVMRSESVAKSATLALHKRLAKANEALLALTPEPGRGRRQFYESEPLRQAIAQVLELHKVEGLLEATIELQQSSNTVKSPKQATGPSATGRHRYKITKIMHLQQSILQREQRLGWRAYVTNAKIKDLSLGRAINLYRQGWAGERDFHLLKDFPLGITPLHVRNDDQIAGLTCLLTLALRLMTLLQIQASEALKQQDQKLEGLYQGNPRRATDKPSALRLLKTISRAQVTLTKVEIDGKIFFHLTHLPALLLHILQLLGFSSSIYERLIDSS